MNSPVRGNKKRADKLKTTRDSIESAESDQRDEQIRNRRGQCGKSRRRAGDDCNRGDDWTEDKKEKHQRKMVK